MQHVNLPLKEEEDEEEEEEEERVGGAHLANCQSNLLLRIFFIYKKNYCVLTCFLVKINVIKNEYLFCN